MQEGALTARILIVDDEPVNVRLLERLLAGAGYTGVSSTTDSRQVLPLVSEFRPDLILLDLAMPLLDGFAVMRQLLAGVAHELNNPLCVVTGRIELLRGQLTDGALGAQLDKVSKAADQCARIVRNFLALARQHPPERSQVRLNDVVREAMDLVA